MAEVNTRLRDLVESRRKELGLTPTKLAEVTGLTTQGLMPIRRGEVKRYQERLTAPLCEALGWSLDSIERIIAGGDPVLVEAPAADDRLLSLVTKHEERIDALERRLREVAELVRDLGERALLPDADELTRHGESRTAR